MDQPSVCLYIQMDGAVRRPGEVTTGPVGDQTWTKIAVGRWRRQAGDGGGGKGRRGKPA